MKRLLMLFGALLLMGSTIYGQVRVTGTVTDARDGQALPGVTVSVQGTTIGTNTDMNGNFELSVPAEAVLQFSFVGYTTLLEPVGDRRVFNVALETTMVGLDEVIVVAYGTTTRASFTGSATVVSGEKLQTIQSSNITSALEGIAPGVQITSATGQPGSESTIRIRGIGSISSSNRPLIILDGVPYDGSLNSINPADIETLNILKDAASSALYGARGANGVIIISTKRGKTGSQTVNFDTRVGVNTRGVPEFDHMTDPQMYIETFWKSVQLGMYYSDNNWDANGNPINSMEHFAQYASNNLFGTHAGNYLGNYNPYNVPDNEVIDPLTGKLNPSAQLLYQDRWHDEMFSNGIRTESNLNISGGVQNTNYRFSFGYLQDQGYVIGSDFERYTTRLSVDQKVNNWLKGGMTAAYAQSETGAPVGTFTTNYSNAFMFTRMIAPLYPVFLRDSLGEMMYDLQGNVLYDFGTERARPYGSIQNPVATYQQDIRSDKRDNTSVQGYLEAKFLENFTFTVNASLNAIGRDNTSFATPLGGDAKAANGRGQITQSRTVSLNSTQLLNYNNTFGLHTVGALIGHESYKWNNSLLYGHKTNFFIPGNPNLDNAVLIEGLNSYTQEYAIEGYLSRLDYNFDNRYYVNASFRRDGSSRFHPDSRWGNFWSIGGSWRINQEAFMSGITWIDDLKVKASFGQQGNDALSYPTGGQNYLPFATQYRVVNNNNEIAINKFYIGNPLITWEKSNSFNTGIDFAFFNRMSGTLEYFQRATTDLLYNRPMPTSAGFSFFSENVADMVNRGVELELNATPVVRRNFRVDVGLNLTHYTNEITKLPPGLEDGIRSGNQWLMQGGSLYDWWMVQAAGLDSIGRQLYKVRPRLLDEDGNPAVDEFGKALWDETQWETTHIYADANQNHNRVNKGSALPDLFGGFNINVRYRSFDFGIISNFQIGGLVYDNVYSSLMHAGQSGDNWHKDILNAWTPDNPNTDIPRLDVNRVRSSNETSDRFLVDASFFNIRNITMGYTFKPNTIPGVNQLRIYGVVDNVALFSYRKGLDPRQSVAGATGYNYSPIRSFSMGLNLSF
ncbi:MAG: SusC/RagA family TonB-linked outer membrane protein [Bacteroidales bacterium]